MRDISRGAGLNYIRLAVVAMVSAMVALTSSPAAMAATRAADPPGTNGTVKIDNFPVDDDISNEPHVTCQFAVKFFGFDENQRANIVFTIQPPSGNQQELLRQNDVLISDDPATGGLNDPDAVFTYSADDLHLNGYQAQPNQGYHVKLSVELFNVQPPEKHKVFWLKPCQTTPPTTAAPTHRPTGRPTATPSGGVLPVTGGGAALGVALVGGLMLIGGAGVLALQRRRHREASGS